VQLDALVKAVVTLPQSQQILQSVIALILVELIRRYVQPMTQLWLIPRV
jgi:hypothetical protein